MVKVKRRRSTRPKVSRKASSAPKIVKPRGIGGEDSYIKKKWNIKKTRQENMRMLGLANDANMAVSSHAREEEDEKSEFVKLALQAHPQSDDLERADTNPRRSLLSSEKQRYISKLIAKHGENFDAMLHDLEANPEQLTVPKLKKLATKFHTLSVAVSPPPVKNMDIDKPAAAASPTENQSQRLEKNTLNKKKKKKKKKKNTLIII